MPAGTAQTLRLSEFWHGSQRIVVGDSAFSSVTTAIECQKKGLFYSGIVKTASKEFPKEAKGDHVSLTTVHNHFRQGLLNIETAWGMQTWWHCLAATFFGMVVTDASIAYNYEYRSEMTIRNFVKEVTISLLFNTFDGSIMVPQRRKSRNEHPSSVPVTPFEANPLQRPSQLSLYKGKMRQKEGARRKCVSCAAHGEKCNTHFYCVTCTDEQRGIVVAVHVCGHGSVRGTECH